MKTSIPLEFDVGDYIKDLKISVPLLVETGPNYKFIHRTLQEYFTAMFIFNETEDNMLEIPSHIRLNENLPFFTGIDL